MSEKEETCSLQQAMNAKACDAN